MVSTEFLENAEPFIQDDHLNAQAYFASVLGMLLLESLFVLPAYLRKIAHRGRPFVKSSHCHWLPRVVYHKLTTLPSLVPFLTHHAVPDLARAVVFIGLNVIFGWNRMRFAGDFRRYGYLCVANGGLALLMGARTNLFSLVVRIPSPTILLYHRFIGVATLVHATLHFSLTARVYIKGDQLDIVLRNKYIQAGLVSFAALCLVGLTAMLRPVRRYFFEVFYYTHFLFLVFVVGALIHADPPREFLLPGLCLWGVDRIIRFAYNFRTVTVKSVTHYDGDVTKIKLEGLKFHHQPGQVAWVQIPSVSFFNWHPFTIASAPGDETSTFAIRGLGGYTKKVQGVATAAGSSMGNKMAAGGEDAVTPQIRIRVDGPYGVGSIQWSQYPVVALVAGGIGITPGISIASHIIRRATAADVADSGKNRWHLHLLWAVREASHTAWFEEELSRLSDWAAGSGGRVSLDVTVFVTARPASSGGQMERSMGEKHEYRGPGVVYEGRPDVAEWFRGVKGARRGLDVAVNLCGPRRLIDDAKSAAVAVSDGESLFKVEEEVFEF